MPTKPRAKCPEVPRLLIEWLEKAIPEPKFGGDAAKMAFEAGRREVVLSLRHQFELQNKKDR